MDQLVEQRAILLPFFVQMLLTLAVWTCLFARRIPFIRRGGLSPEQLRPLEFARLQPPEVANPSDNLKNLFELPTLFLALCLYLYFDRRVDMAYLAAAWIFTGFRILHSAVHCTINIVMLRFCLYLVSALALWFIVLRAALQLLSG